MSSRSRSRQQVGTVVKALAHDSPSRVSRTAAGRMESDRSGKQQQPDVLDASSAGGGLSLLPSVRGLKPSPKSLSATSSPLRTPAGAQQAGSSASVALADSEAQAIEEFRDKFIKSGAIKFSSLREAFRKIDTNKNGLLDEDELTQALQLLNVINVKEGLVSTFVNLCGNGQGEITYDSFVKLLWQDETIGMMDFVEKDLSQKASKKMTTSDRHLWLMRINPVVPKAKGEAANQAHAQSHDKKIHKFGTLNDTWETMRAEQVAEAVERGHVMPPASDPNWPSVEWNVITCGPRNLPPVIKFPLGDTFTAQTRRAKDSRGKACFTPEFSNEFRHEPITHTLLGWYPHNQHHGYDKLPTPRKLKSQQLPVRMTNFTQLSSCEVFRAPSPNKVHYTW